MNLYLLASLLLLVAAADAYRDATYGRSKEPRDAWWWRWHIAKWIALYVPMAIIIYQNFYDMIAVLYLAIAGLLLWRFTAKYIGQAPWMWKR